MCTPNLRIILWTLGRFEKHGTWKLTQLFKKNQQKMKIFMWWIYLDQNNTRHKIWKMKNIFQKWGYRWYFCLKFQLKNENDIKKDNTPIFLKIITFVYALWSKTWFLMLVNHNKFIIEYFNESEKYFWDSFSFCFPLLMEHVTQHDTLWS
jgi:hypothetical protein